MIKSKEQPKQQPKPTSGFRFGSCTIAHSSAIVPDTNRLHLNIFTFRVQQASKSVVLSGTGDEGGFELNAAYRRLRADAMEQVA